MKIKVKDQVYEYDPIALTVREATQIKIQAGLSISEFTQGRFDDPQVLQAILWLCRYRDGELKLRIEDVDAPLMDVDVIPDEEPDEAPTVATLPELEHGSPNGTSEPIDSSPTPAVTG